MTSPSRRARHGRADPRRTRRRWTGSALTALLALALGGTATTLALVGGRHDARSAGPPSARTGAFTSPTATTVPVTTSPTAPPLNAVTIAAVGDTELGNTPDLPSDPSTYLGSVDSALHAEVVFGNLEGTLTDSTASKCGAVPTDCYSFRTPPAYASILRQDGFTVLNSANNHSHDFGAQGVADTTAALGSAGIVQAGLAGQIGVVTDGSTTVAFVGFAPYPDVNNLLDLATASQLIARARTEADLVIVYMHAGAEGIGAAHVTGREETYVGEDRGNAEAFAHAAIDAGADLVLASGPHVLRGMEFYQGHLIAYSLGDFAGYGNFATSGQLGLSGILRVTLGRDGTFESGRFVSLALTGAGAPSLDPSGAAARFVEQLSAEDFGPAAAVIGPTGQISPPPGG